MTMQYLGLIPVTTISILMIMIVPIESIRAKACASCLLAPIDKEARFSGITTVQKSVNWSGCFVNATILTNSTFQIQEQKVTCKGNSAESRTYLQFNKGKTGLFENDNEQSVVIKCNDSAQWEVPHLALFDFTIVIHVIENPLVGKFRRDLWISNLCTSHMGGNY